MGVPTSEVGYTPAMPRREDHEVHKRTCGGIGNIYVYIYIYIYIYILVYLYSVWHNYIIFYCYSIIGYSGVDSASNRNEYQELFPGGKVGRCVRLTTLPPSCAVVMKPGNLNFVEPSGPLQACNGTIGYKFSYSIGHHQANIYKN